MMSTLFLILFLAGSAPLVWLCRRQLINPSCHGFYRFFAFECLLALALINLRPTELALLTPLGIASGACMLCSLAAVLTGLKQLHAAGTAERTDAPENFAFENTQVLVTGGIYRFVRHPMYSSLLLLGAGLFLQKPSAIAALLGLMAWGFVWLTARTEEKENLAFFGEPYQQYRHQSKMLVPFMF